MHLKEMKKYLPAVLIGALILSLSGCKSDIPETEAQKETQTAEETQEEAPAISKLEEFDAKEFVETVNYQGIELEILDDTLTEEEFQERIQYFLNQYATYEEITDRVTEDGDTINLDFYGRYPDGRDIGRGNATNQIYTIGGTFIEDLDRGLIGLTCGETVVLDCIFPEDYHQEELRNQAAKFEVTVNYIQGEKHIPELTDDFVKSLVGYECETKEEFLTVYREELAEAKAASYRESNMDILWGKILSEATFKGYPENYLDAYYTDIMSEVEGEAEMYGMTMKDYLSAYGYTEDEFSQMARANAENYVKSEILYRYIAEKENLQATEEEYLAALQAYVDQSPYFSDVASFVNYFGADIVEKEMYAQATLEKVLNYCYDQAKLAVAAAD